MKKRTEIQLKVRSKYIYIYIYIGDAQQETLKIEEVATIQFFHKKL